MLLKRHKKLDEVGSTQGRMVMDKVVQALTKVHVCTTCGHRQQCGDWLGGRERMGPGGGGEKEKKKDSINNKSKM